MCINRKRQTEAGLLVEEGDDRRAGLNLCLRRRRRIFFSFITIFLSVFFLIAQRLFSVLTLLFLAPALCHPSQLVMFLPQLAETLSLLLQTGLQLQDQDLRTKHRLVNSTRNHGKPKVLNRSLLFMSPIQKTVAWKQTGREQRIINDDFFKI